MENSVNNIPALNKKSLETQLEIRRAAMDLLARRDHSRREIYRKLSPRVDQVYLLDLVLEQLSKDGLQSDERFVESYIRFRRLKGMGPTRIKVELREKGIAENLLADSICKDESIWMETIKKILQKKYGGTTPQTAKDMAKWIRFLTYRGFEYDQIEKALRNEPCLN